MIFKICSIDRKKKKRETDGIRKTALAIASNIKIKLRLDRQKYKDNVTKFITEQRVSQGKIKLTKECSKSGSALVSASIAVAYTL